MGCKSKRLLPNGSDQSSRCYLEPCLQPLQLRYMPRKSTERSSQEGRRRRETISVWARFQHPNFACRLCILMTDPVTYSRRRRAAADGVCFRERCSRWPSGPRAEKEGFHGFPTPRISSPVCARTADRGGTQQRLPARTDMQNVLPHKHASHPRGGREQRVFPNTGYAFCPASSIESPTE